MRPARVAALGVALLLGVPATAGASAPDVLGLGSDATARGGAVVASGAGFASAFYNPAALVLVERSELSIGYLGLVSDLSIRGQTQPIENPHAFDVGIAMPLRFPGFMRERLWLGLAIHTLPDTIVRVITRFPDQPFFPYFENRTQRLVVLPALGIRIGGGLSLGVAANFFAGLDGPARARDGPTRGVETTIFEEIYSRASILAGLRWQPIRQLAFGAAYRQEFYVPYATQTLNLVGGVPLDLGIIAHGLFTPHEIAAGASLTLDRFQAELDVTWALWSSHPGPFVDVDARIQGVSIAPRLPTGIFRNVFQLRAGGRYRFRIHSRADLDARVGLGFEPSVVEDQPGRTNLLDGTKLLGALGAGLRIHRGLPFVLRIDGHVSWTEMLVRQFDKVVSSLEEAGDDPSAIADEDAAIDGVQVTNPGYPSISGGGRVVTFGLTLTAELP